MQLKLPGRLEAVRIARHCLDGLKGQLVDRDLEVLRLLVSELVTNSVRHVRMPGDVEIQLACDEDRIRVCVKDAGAGFTPSVGKPHPAQTSGWGLYLVDQLAAHWGVDSDEQTEVWFELQPSGSRRRHRVAS